MGNQCVYCQKIKSNAPEILTSFNEQNGNENSEYTLLKGNYLPSGQFICNFINFNYRRIYSKLKYERLINKLQSIFCVESIYYPKKKDYYENILNKKLKQFFSNKENILNKIFDNEDIFTGLHDFNHLKTMVKKCYANEICMNNLNFYIDFSEYVKDKKNLKILLQKRKTNNINNKINKTFSTTVRKLLTIQKLTTHKSNDSLFDSQVSVLENDIENLYELCLSKPQNKLPKKIDESEYPNKSYLLMLFTDELKAKSDIFISGNLRNFIKLFYYIYILKKYNFISSTNNNYFKISKDEFIPNLFNKKYYINVSDVNKFKKMRKPKIFKLISKKLKLKSTNDLHFNFNQIPSEEINNKKGIDESNNSFVNEEDENNEINNGEKKVKRIQSMERLSHIKISPNRRSRRLQSKKIKYNNINVNQLEKKSIFRRKPRGKTAKNVPYVNQRKDEIFVNVVDYENSSNYNTKIDFYKGEYDNTIYLYAGLGTLIKQRNHSLYNGTFRYGKKEGIGIYYRHYTEYHFKYYMGEFFQNKFNGFGLLIELNYKYVKIMKGTFHNSHFISGVLSIFNENNDINLLEITKYEGDLEEKKSNIIIYKNYGHLIKLNYSFNESLSKYELDYEYDYLGYFIDGKENGKGILKHTLKHEGYSYEYKGSFVNGEINGYGEIEYSDNYFIKKYEGFFYCGRNFAKYGIVYFKSGDIYEGFFDERYLKDCCGLYWYNNTENNNNENNENNNKNKGNDNYFGGFKEDKKFGFGRYISYQDNLTKLLIGNYSAGEKNGLFDLIYNEENKNAKQDKKIKPVDITSAITNLLSGQPMRNPYEFVIQTKVFYMFENGQLIEKSDKPFKNNIV